MIFLFNKSTFHLHPDQFIRAYRSYIVNVDEIKEIVTISHGRQVVFLKNGTQISLSRSGALKIKRFYF